MLVCLVLATGCGSSTKTVTDTGANGQVTTSTVPNVHFAKTKFAIDAGLAFGAFHRYIYKPFKSGQLGGGLLHNKKSKLKAALAAAFAYNRVKAALRAALRSTRPDGEVVLVAHHYEPLELRSGTLIFSSDS